MIGPSQERGTALVAALLFSIVVLGLVTTIISSGLSVKQQTRYMLARQGAQQAAESGVHLTLAKLAGPDAAEIMAAGRLEGVIRGSGERAPRYEVTITPAGADGADNDLDGAIDEADENDMTEVSSTGRFDNVMRTVRVTLLARYRQPEYPSATYIADPLADVRFNGNSFLISGIDVDLDGNPTGSLVPGIGVNGSATYLVDQLRNNQNDNVVGAGEDPSVATVAELDLQELVEEGARSANVTLEGQSVYQPENEGDWGTIGHPSILYAPGSVKISGGASGAGMLIVNGDLTITGGFSWQGLIIVKGRVEFKGGGGGKRLTGALVIADDLFASVNNGDDDDDDDVGEGINVSGTIDILFSEQTLSRVTQVFRNFSILNWREGPNPDYDAGS